jgi:hypothetical protein
VAAGTVDGGASQPGRARLNAEIIDASTERDELPAAGFLTVELASA